jgi:L-alanine-DL-glutamate epimerase-like enolase superfamily enzyme
MALSAVDCALWDLKARLLDVPLHRLVGAVHDAVPVYGSGGFTTYDDERLVDQLTGWVHDQRIPRVKIKIGESWGAAEERDLRRVALAREVVGPTAELYVDANGGYSVGQAVRVDHRMREHDVRWFEEPVSSDHPDRLRDVRTAVRADVAAGEYGWDLASAQRLCAAGAVDCLQVDVTRCGGITELFRIAAVAAAHGLQVSGHCAPHLHLAPLLSVPNLRHLEWFHDHVRIESMLLEEARDPGGGAVKPPDGSGHGFTVRLDRAEQFRVA